MNHSKSHLIRFFMVLLTALYAVGSQAQIDCQKFRYGKFEIVDGSINHQSVITRYDDIQIEKDLSTGNVLKFKVKWISECEYSLKLIEGTSPDDVKSLKDLDFFVKILATTDDQYTFEASIPKVNFKSTFFMRKLH